MSTPAYPGGSPAGAVTPPPSVQTAFLLFIVNVVLGVIGSLLSFPARIDIAITGLSTAQQEAAARTGVIIAIVIALALFALYLFFVFQMRNGKNWARIVLTVLSVLSIVAGLAGLGVTSALFGAGVFGLLSVILSILSLVLLIAAVVYMFRPDANAYFSAPR